MSGFAGRGRAALIAAGMWSVSALAAESGAPGIATPSPASSMLQVLIGLVVVLVAIAGTAWLLRRMMPGQSAAGGLVKVVGGVMVGPKERVVLVEVNETWLVLGVAAGQVNALHTMSRPDNYTPDQSTADVAFKGWMKKVRERREAQSAGPG